MDSLSKQQSNDASSSPGVNTGPKKKGMTWLGFIGFLVVYVFIGACGDPDQPPGPPSTISIITGEGGLIDTDGIFSAGWTAPTGDISHYDIEYRSDGTQWQPVISGVSNTSFNAITLSSGLYEYRFRACNADACGDWSSPVSIHVNLFSASQALANNSPYEVYRGDVNGDQIADIYFKYKDDLLLLHSVSGTVAAPLVIPSDQDSFLMAGLASGGFADPVVNNAVDTDALLSVNNDARLFDYDGDGELDLYVDLSSSGQGNIVFDLINNAILASDINFQQVGASATVAIDPEDGVYTGAAYNGALVGQHSANADGSFSYSIEIDVPPGIAGMQPNIALDYNSNRSNGVVGWGWAISGQSMISRCRASKMRDGYFSNISNGSNYKFCLDGQRLVEVAAGEYRTEVESFSIIRAVGGTPAVPQTWTVTTAGGEVFSYGNLSGEQASASDSAVFTDGSGDAMQWYLRKHQDLAGNYIDYHYESNAVTGEHRIHYIDYTKNISQSGINNRVIFEYENRTDQRGGYRAGRAYLTAKRLSSIVTKVNTLAGDLTSGSQVSRYQLTYQQPVTNGTNYNDPVNTSRIKTITRCFNDMTVCAEPIQLDWQDVKTVNDGEWINMVSEFRYGDFNGDGILDVMGMLDEDCNNDGPSATALVLEEVERCAVVGIDSINLYVAYGDQKITPTTNLEAYSRDLTLRITDPAQRELVVADIESLSYVYRTTFPNFAKTPHMFGTLDFNSDGLDDIYIMRTPLLPAGSNPQDITWDDARKFVMDVYLANAVAADSSDEKFTYSAGYSQQKNEESRYHFDDFNGDGLVDAMLPDVVALNNGSGFDAPLAWPGAYVPDDWLLSWAWGSIGRMFRDINADGLIDGVGRLYSEYGQNTGFGFNTVPINTSVEPFTMLSEANFHQMPGHWAAGGCTPSQSAYFDQIPADPLANSGHPYMKQPDFGDFNGDGYQDAVLQCDEGVFVMLGVDDNQAATAQLWNVNGEISSIIEHDVTGTLANIQSEIYRLPAVTADINNDGLDDVMNPITREVWFSTSIGFNGPFEVFGDAQDFKERYYLGSYDTSSQGSADQRKELSLVDFNGDGLPEVKSNLELYDIAHAWSESSWVPIIPDFASFYPATQINKDNILIHNQDSKFGSQDDDFHNITIRESVNRLGGHQLQRINTAFGQSVDVVMLPTAQGDVYTPGASDTSGIQGGNAFDIHASGSMPIDESRMHASTATNIKQSTIVVESITVDNGQGETDTSHYTYADQRIHKAGFGLLGFSTRTETQFKPDENGVVNKIYSVYHYYQNVKHNDTDPEKYALAGKPKQTLTYIGPETATDVCVDNSNTGCLRLISDTRYQWKVRTYLDDIDPQVPIDAAGTLGAHPSPHYFVYLAASSEATYDLTTGALISESRTDNQLGAANSCAQIPDTVLDGTTAISEVSSDVDYHVDGVLLSSLTATCDAAASAHAVTASLQTVDATTIVTMGNARGLVQNRSISQSTGADLQSLAVVTRAESYTYNTLGQMASKTIGLNGSVTEQLTTAYTYDGYGLPHTVTDSWTSSANDGLWAMGSQQRSSSVQNTYLANGQRTQTSTNALGHVSTTIFEARFGQATSATDANGLVKQMQYDNLGRLTTTSYPDGTATVNRYLACNDCFDYSAHEQWYVHSKTTGQAPRLNYFDGLGRELGSQALGLNGAAVFSYAVYDQYNQVTAASDPFFAGETPALTQSSYDVLGRVVQVDFADGSQQTTTHVGNTETLVNRENQNLTRIYNHAGWVMQSTDNAGTPVDFTYYPFGNLKTTQVNNDADTLVSLQYDVLGRKTQLDDPNTGIIQYRYNPLGLLAQEEDARGQVTQYQYDALGRQIERIDDFTSAVSSSSYPTRRHRWIYDTATNGIGQLATLHGFDTEEQEFIQTYQYNTLSLPVSTNTDYDGYSDKIETRYDDFSRPLATVYPTGYMTVNHYNEWGYLSQVKDALADTLLWEANEQDARGNITRSTLGNGVVTQRSYNAATGRIETIQASKGSVVVQDHSYQFSPLGNLAQRSDNAANIHQYFCYDPMNRLRVAFTGTPCTSGTAADYSYDALGNITTHKQSPGATYQYGVNAGPHAVTSIGNKALVYDANGNFIQSNVNVTGEEKKVTYSAFNKPTLITRGASMGLVDYSTRITYGPDKMRVKRLDSTGKETRYVGGIYEESRHNGELEQVHYLGDFGLFVLKSGSTASSETVYQHRDHIGSIVARTHADVDALSDVDFMANDPWGNRVDGMWGQPQSGTGFVPEYTARGFTDHEHLDGVGLIHMNGRVYDPTMGRFLSPDPLVQAPNNSQSYNRYTYVFNNPLSFFDPTGYASKRKINGVEVKGRTLPKLRIGGLKIGGGGSFSSFNAALANRISRFMTGERVVMNIFASRFKQAKALANRTGFKVSVNGDIFRLISAEDSTEENRTANSEKNSNALVATAPKGMQLAVGDTITVRINVLLAQGKVSEALLYAQASAAPGAAAWAAKIQGLQTTIQSVIARNPCNSGNCAQVAQAIANAFTSTSTRAQPIIYRLNPTKTPNMYISNKVVAPQHFVTRVGNTVYDSFTGAQGMAYHTYVRTISNLNGGSNSFTMKTVDNIADWL